MSHLGDLLRRHREQRGLSQEDLAALVEPPLSTDTISNVERGRTRPHRHTLEALCQALRLDEPARQEVWTARRSSGAAMHMPRAAPAISVRHNLPLELTSFIGREQELADVQQRLATTRLLTLVGAGGVGKSRLAMHAARQARHEYADGVWLAELAPLADPAFVPQTVAAALGVRVATEPSITTALATAVGSRQLLLVLDNCEHVLDACAQLVDALLRACPQAQVLATSREALGLTGEVAWRVPSLPVPDPERLPSIADLQQQPAMHLFVERAVAVLPQFALSQDNAALVAQVCRRLDGIPLALELAAVRVQALTLSQLATRLDQRFRLLTGGSRAALPRQQTLRATMDWSYDLLSETERQAFGRVSVFAGGWSLAAAEAVCAGDGIPAEDVLDLLARLVQKSLVVADGGTSGAERYHLLETLRQYAREHLVATGEAEAVHQRHALYYLGLAEGVELRGWGTYQPEWLDSVLPEHDNLRAALVWFIDTDAAEPAVRLAGVLYPVWLARGSLSEGRAQLRTVLAMPAETHSAAWAQLHNSAAVVASACGDYDAARSFQEQSAALWRTLGDVPHLAITLFWLGVMAREQEDYAAARRALEECLALAHQLQTSTGIARTLDSLGTVDHARGEYAQAQSCYEASLALARKVDDQWEQAWSLHNLGCLALDQGDHPTARACLVEALSLRGAYDRAGLLAQCRRRAGQPGRRGGIADPCPAAGRRGDGTEPADRHAHHAQ